MIYSRTKCWTCSSFRWGGEEVASTTSAHDLGHPWRISDNVPSNREKWLISGRRSSEAGTRTSRPARMRQRKIKARGVLMTARPARAPARMPAIIRPFAVTILLEPAESCTSFSLGSGRLSALPADDAGQTERVPRTLHILARRHNLPARGTKWSLTRRFSARRATSRGH